MIVTAVVILFAAIGVFFTFVAAVGMIRLPDVYSRSHGATKADTLGSGFALVAVAIYFGSPAEIFRIILLLVFIYFTAPTAAHAITRAANSQDVEVWTKEEEEGPE